ncbi:hypothetical protein JCM21142_41492 [Saccharicrinis fermentans DSM 9555 = JCM 21142]|uniref:Uncharacterized protein n=2 Tax=Saccharicrinis fermentans TaxID=982 RepID=W7Y451_9BACT|nr:hypothetical protein JCM21142_41492 [Saccharicrinis fermentans DSM 9555 = JCM 21142]
MKNYFAFLWSVKVFMLFTLLLCSLALYSQTTEDFELEINATSFTSEGVLFNVSGQLEVVHYNAYGANASNYYMESEFGVPLPSQTLGSISIASGKVFNLYSAAVWPSIDAGSSQVVCLCFLLENVMAQR